MEVEWKMVENAVRDYICQWWKTKVLLEMSKLILSWIHISTKNDCFVFFTNCNKIKKRNTENFDNY